jgi:flagellin
MEGGFFMALRIMTNVAAAFAQRQLSANSTALSKSLERLSSGYRINHAGDDSAGLAISTRMQYQIEGMEQAQRNVQDGISLVQVAEGGLEELVGIMQRMRVLSVQASNGTLSASDRTLIQTEVTQLICEIDRMGSTIEFNGVNLLRNATGSITLHVGSGSGETLSIALRTSNLTSISSTRLNVNTLQVTSTTTAQNAMSALDGALSNVIALRAAFGAAQNRLETANSFLGIQRENMMASQSRIKDVDFASEMTSFTRNQILIQASTAMLAQANLVPSAVLQLFA